MLQTDTSVLKLDINLIIPNKYQPRKTFDDKALDSLSESIKHYGIINPILLRKKEDKYEIIAGERRYRAAKQAGLTEVPVIIKNANEQQMAELALIENIQRQSLNPIEEAKSYEEIMRIGNQTQSSLAEKLGKSQSSIANKIRLLTLPIEIQESLADKKISERHARSLMTVDNKEKQLELLDRIIKEKLTVKETEQIINEKEITEEEIKQAISDIMKSLNINEEEKEEKEDDNMNNGNFFPNFDNNNAVNNTSLNMMNMQSMNQNPVIPEPEMVMPTVMNPVQEPQVTVSSNPVETPMMSPVQEQSINNFEQFGPSPVMTPELNMNNSFNSIDSFASLPNDMVTQTPTMMPTMEVPMMNNSPMFTQQFAEQTTPVEEPQMVNTEVPVMDNPVVDVPLFNPDVIMPSVEPSMFGPMQETIPNEPQPIVTEQPMMTPSFEVPVTNPEPLNPPVVDKLTELQNLLVSNGYNYKVYSNETDNCVIIELPRN